MIAGSATLALLFACVYAPLFHVHTDGGEAPLLHAHFPELEVSEDDSVVHMERPHSHASARSIDLLITTAANFIQFDAVILITQVMPGAVEPCCGFVSIATARAHAPPEIPSRIPRAPPA